MPADQPAVLAQVDPVGVGVDLDRPPHRAGRDRVLVVVEADEAGLGDGRHHLVEAVEGPAIGHEARTLGLEDLPDRPAGDLGVRLAPGPGDGPLHQPVVELLEAPDPDAGAEQPVPRRADLVLDLPLLPARGRRAGRRLDEVVAAHLQEAAVERALLADEHRVHRGLRSSGD
jgi:hypothetical protein